MAGPWAGRIWQLQREKAAPPKVVIWMRLLGNVDNLPGKRGWASLPNNAVRWLCSQGRASMGRRKHCSWHMDFVSVWSLAWSTMDLRPLRARRSQPAAGWSMWGRCGSRPSGERLSSRKASRTSLSGLEPCGSPRSAPCPWARERAPHAPPTDLQTHYSPLRV